MSDHGRIRVMLELELGSDPIVGTLLTQSGRVDFSGWLGLAAALEQAISSAPDGAAERLSQNDAPGLPRVR